MQMRRYAANLRTRLRTCAPHLGVLSFTLLLAPAPAVARGIVFLNEVLPRGEEWVELYNSVPVPTVIGGWRLVEGSDVYIFQGGTTIPAFGYFVVELGGILNDLGGEIALIDLKDEIQDAVSYGQLGSAPLPPSTTLLGGLGMSLARSPDASQGLPPPPDPDDDGRVWTLDDTITLAAPNDAPGPQLGTSAVLNEVGLGSDDAVEVFNPTAANLDLDGWTVTNGIVVFGLTGGIGPGGYRAFALPNGFDLDASLLLYLFDNLGRRRDQLGFAGAPPEPIMGETTCYGRSPDGTGPNLGYDWTSSGGGVTLFPLPCTLGGRNRPASDVPDPGIPPSQWSWGELKVRWNQ